MHENALSFPVDTGATELQIRTSKEIEECALTSYGTRANTIYFDVIFDFFLQNIT